MKYPIGEELASALVELRFQPVPEGNDVILRALLEDSTFTPDKGACGVRGRCFSFSDSFNLLQTIAMDEEGDVWLAQGHINLEHLGFQRGSFSLKENGSLRMQ